jgi:hypothetical protein
LCFEITQESLKNRLVVLRVRPLGEVSNMALLSQFAGPVRRTVEDGVINANGKENFPFLSDFPAECGFYFK